ncbi:MAG: hypothetical protein RJAPGHWK_002795 [Candidatus Fervidibacter sp.]
MWRKFLAFVRLQLAVQMEYRVVMWIWLLSGFALPLINLAVWTSVAAHRPVAGFSAADFVSYFLAVMAVDHFTAEWSAYEWEWYVRQGQLSSRLLRPVDPVWELAAANVAYKLAQAVILLPVWALLWKLLAGTPYQLTPAHFALFLLTLTLAGMLNFLMGYCFAMLAFWTVRVGAFYEMFAWGIGYFLSGRLAPLEVLPSWVNAIANFLPFRYIIALPVEVLMGRAEPSLVLRGLTVQVIWLVACLVIKRWLWRCGLRRYTAVGG